MKKAATPVKKVAAKMSAFRATDKKKLKAKALDSLRGSFAIEGIRFSDKKFEALKTRINSKK